jgi:putative FmdB family regulatory protein
MPIYEYVCSKCGKKTEIIQRMSDKPLTHCPHCGGKVKKAISAPAIQFKGSGWYVTDYGSGATKASRSEGEAGEKAEKNKSDKSEKSEKSDKPDKSEAKPDRTEKKKAKKDS